MKCLAIVGAQQMLADWMNEDGRESSGKDVTEHIARL